MKTMKLKLWLIVTMLLCLPTTIKANIQHTVTFSADELTIKNDTIEGLEFSSVKYGDLSNNGNPGDPSLPVKYLTFSVPYDAYNISVSATCGNAQEIGVPMWLVPVQEPQIISAPKNPFTDPNLDIYDIDSYFPANVATISNEGFLYGDNHLITVAIRPIQYNGARNLVRLNKSISISISYISGNGTEHMAMKPVFRQLGYDRANEFETVKSTVLNPSQVIAHSAPLVNTPRNYTSYSMYEYTIVTSRELAPAFERLVALKRVKGYDAGIICVEDILENPEFSDGDLVSGINDDAGKLRAYLRKSFECHALKYVLLGGKEPHVPIRYGYDTEKIPTDLYFSEFNGNWNSDRDTILGEVEKDNIDFMPDVCIGRLLCTTQKEVNNYIDKLITYEINPGNGEYDYLGKALSIHDTEHTPGERFKDVYMPDPRSYLNNCNVIIPEGKYPKGQDVISCINKSISGQLYLWGHGNPGGVAVNQEKINSGYTKTYGITTIDNENWYHEPEENNGLDNLDNKCFPFVICAMSCNNIPFDKYQEYNLNYNLGESFTLGKDYGGVAYIGNTRTVYASPAILVTRGYMQNILNGSNIGTAIFLTKGYSNIDYGNSQVLKNNLLGDPEISVFFSSPLKYDSIGIERNDYSVIIEVPENIENGYISILTPDNGAMRYAIEHVGTNVLEVSPNSSIAITGKNMIMYLAPLLIQNQIYASSQYLFASSAKLGNFVDENRIFGTVQIFSNLTIDACEEIYLGDGVIINEDAQLILKSKQRVTIDGGYVNNGGKLVIEAPEIVVLRNFEAEQGAEVEIITIK